MVPAWGKITFVLPLLVAYDLSAYINNNYTMYAMGPKGGLDLYLLWGRMGEGEEAHFRLSLIHI